MVAPLNIQTVILSDVVYTTLALLETSHFVFYNITCILHILSTSKKAFMSKPGTRRTYGSRQEYSIYAMSTAGTTLGCLTSCLAPHTSQEGPDSVPFHKELYRHACADLYALASALNILPTMEHLKMVEGYC